MIDIIVGIIIGLFSGKWYILLLISLCWSFIFASVDSIYDVSSSLYQKGMSWGQLFFVTFLSVTLYAVITTGIKVLLHIRIPQLIF